MSTAYISKVPEWVAVQTFNKFNWVVGIIYNLMYLLQYLEVVIEKWAYVQLVVYVLMM